MDENIKKIVSSLRNEIKEDILRRYNKVKYWNSLIISRCILLSNLHEDEKLKIIKEIYNLDKATRVSDLPDWMQNDFDLHEFDEIEQKYICKYCEKSAKVYRMFDIDGKNLEEHLVCLSCGDGQPALTH